MTVMMPKQQQEEESLEERSDVATTGQDIASLVSPQRHEDAAPSLDSEGYFEDTGADMDVSTDDEWSDLVATRGEIQEIEKTARLGLACI
ncbi:hypothetical protein AeMF1_006707 [Aphanomyces euteiches]|nr:hypothetical protein AeMF1_006707 [Aphanomyces euteiches]KAH9180186.1 hypothetical protein AeNC1_017171 [Aphanomyces euteiches]